MKHDSGCHCGKFRCKYNRKINLHRKGIKKMRKTIVIFSAAKARELLKNGFQIVDIKPHKNDPTKKQSVFVFKYDDRINDFI